MVAPSTDRPLALARPARPTVHAAIQRVLDIVAATELALGIMVNSAQAAQQWRARGARYIAVGMEALLMPAARGYLQAAPEG